MWQYAVTAAILLVALVFVVRRVVRTLKGRDSFSCAFCREKDCPGRSRDAGEDVDCPGRAPDDDKRAGESPSGDPFHGDDSSP